MITNNEKEQVKSNKINFTKVALYNLKKPAKNFVTYRDTKIRGLYLYITKNGVITFFIQKKLKGKPIIVNIGQFPYVSIENARYKAMELLTQIVNGINPKEVNKEVKRAEEKQEREELRLDELFDIYIKKHAKVYKKTWEKDIEGYNRHIKKKLGRRRVSEIRKDELVEVQQYIRENSGLYASNRTMAVIKTVFSKAIEWGIIKDLNKNPTMGIKKFKEKSRDRFLEADELPRFFEALREEENTDVRDYIIVPLMTGARRGNVLSMKWEEINIGSRKWKIPETKNGEALTIPLSEEAVEILKVRKAHQENCGIKLKWVFPSDKSKGGHLGVPKERWIRILKRANIKNLRIHDLRRTLGSWQAMTGTSTAVIGKTLGHKSRATTAIYERMNLDPVRDSINKACDTINKE